MITQRRFDELAAKHNTPGAVVGVLTGDEVHQLATGVLHVGTGAATAVDSLFQIGSITKPYTATMLMRLVEQGRVGLETRVVEVLPDFRVADPQASEHVTMRHLLTHTSGIAGDFVHDTGRGDDTLARYVAACADLPQEHPLGSTMSYSNTGYNIAGRVIEVLTGLVWDEALRTLVLDPLGAGHTWTLPEDVLRFSAAMGHTLSPDTGRPVPASVWIPGFRSDGPCGNISASAADILAFARLHMSDPRLAVMREPQVAVPSPLVDHWGLGWNLWTWDGHPVFGHSGDTMGGQSAQLRVVPDKDVAMVLLTNIGDSTEFQEELLGQLLRELCDIEVPPRPSPPAEPVRIDDLGRFVGIYERSDARVDITLDDERSALRLRHAVSGIMADFDAPFEFGLTPVSDTMFVGRESDTARWKAVVFDDDYIYVGIRVYARNRAARP
ncbi:MAG TPA: serine hydrolase domain-containing protein [Pseudonocardiaceae bacterium]|nr:serine hydrolase domain-containing protein [Pseudonocardiaceae bacterium]